MTRALTNEEIFESQRPAIEASIRRTPFLTYIGAEFVRLAPGHCAMKVRSRPELLQGSGFFHGGMVGTMADCTMAIAASTTLPSLAAEYVVTSEFKLNFLSPAIGPWLISRADVLKSGRLLVTVEAKVFIVSDVGTEKLVAAALGTMARTRAATPV